MLAAPVLVSARHSRCLSLITTAAVVTVIVIKLSFPFRAVQLPAATLPCWSIPALAGLCRGAPDSLGRIVQRVYEAPLVHVASTVGAGETGSAQTKLSAFVWLLS